MKILETARKFIPNIPIPDSLVKEIEDDGAAYRTLGKGEKWLAMTTDVASLAADAGEPLSYTVYLNGTNLVHSNPIRERSYVREVNGHTWFNNTDSLPEDGWTPFLAAKHLLWIGEAVGRVFELGGDERLREVQEEVASYVPEGPPA